MGMDDLQWQDGEGYIEANLDDYLDDKVIDRFEYINCSIRRYKTVYTIAAIIDKGNAPAFDMYDHDELAFYADAGTEFYKLGSWRITELTSDEFKHVIKDLNRKLMAL
jgi:hypothetical protein